MLGSTQSDVSKLERRSDARLSTLSSYVAVLGGVLEVRARFGTLAIRIGFPEEAAVEEAGFWGRHFPGFRSLPQRDFASKPIRGANS